MLFPQLQFPFHPLPVTPSPVLGKTEHFWGTFSSAATPPNPALPAGICPAALEQRGRSSLGIFCLPLFVPRQLQPHLRAARSSGASRRVATATGMSQPRWMRAGNADREQREALPMQISAAIKAVNQRGRARERPERGERERGKNRDGEGSGRARMQMSSGLIAGFNCGGIGRAPTAGGWGLMSPPCPGRFISARP